MKTIFPAILKLILVYSTLFVSGKAFEKNVTETFKPCIPELILNQSTDKDSHFTGLTFNVWGLPISLPGHDQSTRFKKLADSISSRGFDIICLQEVFHKNVRSELIRKLLPGYCYGSDYECNQSILGKLIQKDCHGGLMTLSKYPIISESFYPFSYSAGTSIIEKIGGKGFLFTTILRNGEPINIINTHLYAGGSEKAARRRKDQILEMEKILTSIHEFHLYPTLLFGDLNIQHPSRKTHLKISTYAKCYAYLTQKIGFEDPITTLNESTYTINPDNNIYTPENEPKQKLDYIMFHVPDDSNHCIYLDRQALEFQGKSAISDHLGWKARINIEFLNKTNT